MMPLRCANGVRREGQLAAEAQAGHWRSSSPSAALSLAHCRPRCQPQPQPPVQMQSYLRNTSYSMSDTDDRRQGLLRRGPAAPAFPAPLLPPRAHASAPQPLKPQPHLSLFLQLLPLLFLLACLCCTRLILGVSAQLSSVSSAVLLSGSACARPLSLHGNGSTVLVACAGDSNSGDGDGGGLFRLQRTDSAATSTATLALLVPRTQCLSATRVCVAGTHVYAVCLKRACDDAYCGSVVAINEEAAAAAGAPRMQLLSGSQCFSPASLSVHERTQEVWIGCQNTFTFPGQGLIRVNGLTSATLEVDSLLFPLGCFVVVSSVVIQDTGTVIIACDSGGVYALDAAGSDLSTARLWTLIPSGHPSCVRPTGVVWHSASERAIVACEEGEDSIIAVDLTGGNLTFIAPHSACLQPSDLALQPDTGRVFVACQSSGITTAIMGGQHVTLASLLQVPAPRGVYYDSSSGNVYAASSLAVVAIGPTLTPLTVPSMCATPAAAVSLRNGSVFALCSGGTIVSGTIDRVFRIDGATTTELVILSRDYSCWWTQGDRRMVWDEPSQQLWLSCTNDAGTQMTRMDGPTGAVTVIDFGLSCPSLVSFAVHSAKRWLYLVCAWGSGVIRKSYAPGASSTSVTVADRYSACPQPKDVAVNARTGLVWVSCFGSFRDNYLGRVLVIRDELVSGPVVTVVHTLFEAGHLTMDHANDDVFVDTREGVVRIREGRTLEATIWINHQDCPRVNALTLAANGSAPDPTAVAATGLLAACGGGAVHLDLRSGAVRTLVSGRYCAMCGGVSFDALSGLLHAVCMDSAVLAVSASLPACLPGYEYHDGLCVPCALGKYRTVDMQRDNATPMCAACMPGEVAPSHGNMQCARCTAGTFAFNPVVPCINCSSGYMSARARERECERCPVGRFSPLGSSTCSACVPGRYTATVASGDCVDCPRGRWTDLFGADECSLCAAGFAGETTGLTTPTCSGPCAEGYWCAAGSVNRTQQRCGARSVYCPTQSDRPLSVQAGWYTAGRSNSSDEERMMWAVPCPPGHACDGSGRIEACKPGTYAADHQSATCTSCAPGTASDLVGSTTPCAPCTNYTYADQFGMTSCLSCNPRAGRFTPLVGGRLHSVRKPGGGVGYPMQCGFRMSGQLRARPRWFLPCLSAVDRIRRWRELSPMYHEPLHAHCRQRMRCMRPSGNGRAAVHGWTCGSQTRLVGVQTMDANASGRLPVRQKHAASLPHRALPTWLLRGRVVADIWRILPEQSKSNRRGRPQRGWQQQ